MNSGCGELCIAIVEKACKDYKVALKKLERDAKRKKPRTAKMENEHFNSLKLKREVELFFYSAWFEQMSGIDPDMLLHKLTMEVKDGKMNLAGLKLIDC